MKFVHMGDCHLGGWRQPELQMLNLESFRNAIDTSIKEKVDCVLIAGDLFDSAYPPMEIIKYTFAEFRKLKDANIPVFFIAGSHDFSASGKSFLDVLEHAGFAKNVYRGEDRNGSIVLEPTIFKNVAIYGYPGKKTGLEVDDVNRIKINDSPGLFKILMLHTTLRDAVKNLPIPAVDHNNLPKVDYYALAHLHINYQKGNRIYCGPTFPNNAQELEELQGGSFFIIDTNGKTEKREIKLKSVLVIEQEIKNAFSATDEILDNLKKYDLKDKIVILRLIGTLEIGTTADIKMNDLESYVRKQGAFVLLKSTTKLYAPEGDISFEVPSENLEEEAIKKFQDTHSNPLNKFIPSLINILQMEKKEEEKSQIFEERLFAETKKVISL